MKRIFEYDDSILFPVKKSSWIIGMSLRRNTERWNWAKPKCRREKEGNNILSSSPFFSTNRRVKVSSTTGEPFCRALSIKILSALSSYHNRKEVAGTKGVDAVYIHRSTPPFLQRINAPFSTSIQASFIKKWKERKGKGNFILRG